MVDLAIKPRPVDATRRPNKPEAKRRRCFDTKAQSAAQAIIAKSEKRTIEAAKTAVEIPIMATATYRVQARQLFPEDNNTITQMPREVEKAVVALSNPSTNGLPKAPRWESEMRYGTVRTAPAQTTAADVQKEVARRTDRSSLARKRPAK